MIDLVVMFRLVCLDRGIVKVEVSDILEFSSDCDCDLCLSRLSDRDFFLSFIKFHSL